MKDKYVWIIYAELVIVPIALWAFLFVLGLPSEISSPIIIIAVITVVALTIRKVIGIEKASRSESSSKDARKHSE